MERGTNGEFFGEIVSLFPCHVVPTGQYKTRTATFGKTYIIWEETKLKRSKGRLIIWTYHTARWFIHDFFGEAHLNTKKLFQPFSLTRYFGKITSVVIVRVGNRAKVQTSSGYWYFVSFAYFDEHAKLLGSNVRGDNAQTSNQIHVRCL